MSILYRAPLGESEIKMAASIMFPVIGAGQLIITYIFFRFMFKEKLKVVEQDGIYYLTKA